MTTLLIYSTITLAGLAYMGIIEAKRSKTRF